MRNYTIFVSASLVLFALFIAGCAKPPHQELRAAKAALDSALAVQADKYAATDYTSAKESLDKANTEIEKKHYDKAKEDLVSATTSANNAKTEAVEAKKQAATDADSALANANTLLAEVKNLMKKTSRGRPDLMNLINELSAVESSLGEAQAAYGSGDYLNARDKATACVAKLGSLKNEFAVKVVVVDKRHQQKPKKRVR